jgi:site-specific DNA-methyltransferase (adenine-specific)/modification methylase
MSRVEQIGRATLYLGDCRDILPTLGKVDAVVTDPPYGIGESSKKAATRGRASELCPRAIVKTYHDDAWDHEPCPPEVIQWARENSRWQVIFGGNYFDLPPTSCWLIWDKENSGDFADAEIAWTNIPRAIRLIRHMWNGMLRKDREERFHLTQKPLAVMKWAIGHVPSPAETILDLFMGSGTTGVAAVQMGRSFIGIERETKYFDIACRRIEDAQRQGDFFVEAAA